MVFGILRNAMSLNASQIMEGYFNEAILNGYTRDANDLSVYATAEGIVDSLSNLRILASDILNRAGYCECGTKFTEADRCSCGRRITRK